MFLASIVNVTVQSCVHNFPGACCGGKTRTHTPKLREEGLLFWRQKGVWEEFSKADPWRKTMDWPH